MYKDEHYTGFNYRDTHYRYHIVGFLNVTHVQIHFRLIDQLVASEDFDAAIEKETKNWIGKLLYE